MNVLVIGQGAREHALSRKLAESAGVSRVYCAPGNAGTSTCATNLAVSATDLDGIVAATSEYAVGLVVVGPEAPLAMGLVDRLRDAGVPAFGPTQAAAQLESSKSFSKDFMKEHAIPTAGYGVFDDAGQATAWVRELDRPMVVKADGLAAGKGVVVASTVEETLAAIDSIMDDRIHGDAGARVVVEELLVGPEVSYHVLTDGHSYVPLAAAQDHKRLLDGDLGPNTGGMGAYSPPPMVTADIEQTILKEIVEPTLKGMAKRGTPVQGVLFLGLMIVDGAPQLLEYNVRFGDPETEVLMARMTGDLLPLLLGAASGDLGGKQAQFIDDAALCVVMASGGYPGPYTKGLPIQGIEAVDGRPDVAVYQAGTVLGDAGGPPRTAGGRVLVVTARGSDIAVAADKAYDAVAEIEFEGAIHRRDIGWQAR